MGPTWRDARRRLKNGPVRSNRSDVSVRRRLQTICLSCVCLMAPLGSALLGGSGIAGCDAVESDTYHQRVQFIAPDESFALSYVAPPWVATQGGAT